MTTTITTRQQTRQEWIDEKVAKFAGRIAYWRATGQSDTVDALIDNRRQMESLTPGSTTSPAVRHCTTNDADGNEVYWDEVMYTATEDDIRAAHARARAIVDEVQSSLRTIIHEMDQRGADAATALSALGGRPLAVLGFVPDWGGDDE